MGLSFMRLGCCFLFGFLGSDALNIAIPDSPFGELIVRPIGDSFLVEFESARDMLHVPLDVFFQRTNLDHDRCSYGYGPHGGVTGGTGPDGKPSSDVRS